MVLLSWALPTGLPTADELKDPLRMEPPEATGEGRGGQQVPDEPQLGWGVPLVGLHHPSHGQEAALGTQVPGAEPAPKTTLARQASRLRH